jgi:tetratricopeptide (TPR) repeat protein
MVLRLSSSVARIILIVAAFFLASALAYSSIRNAIAVHDADLDTRNALERSTQLEPGNPFNWYLLGRYWQYNLDEPDSQRAINAYHTSLSLDPRSANTWLDLATVHEMEGDLPAARDAYLQAKRVYPLSAEVAWRYGNFLLRQDELPLAFAEIRHAVSIDPKRAAEAFSRCWRVDPDIQSILDKVLPPSGPVYLDAISIMINDTEIDPALAVWDRLVAIHPPLHLNDVIRFTDTLIFAHRLDDARRVWDQGAALSGTAPSHDPPGSVLWDGGFESDVIGGGFAWSFAPPSSGVHVSLDSKEKHSGHHSLQLGFDGKHNVNFSDVCHLVVVQPSTTYLFSAWVHTLSLFTDQGIRFRLEWIENSHSSSVDTPEVHGTQPWTKIEMPWTAGLDVQQVRVCVCRNPSDIYGSRIRGTAWVDDVALVPEDPENIKP